MCEFEKKVLDSLIECGIPADNLPYDPRIGVAVSGGVDSVSLLLALSQFFSPLYVITVNHNIRPAAESGGDVEFVLELCEKLRSEGKQIICEVAALERGEVDIAAAERGGGTEEAARHLRYAAFEQFVASRELTALCLAHHRNDQLETILMRFLQGSPSEAAAGIRARRDHFLRPLLGITRQEIEQYVRGRGYSWRTDKTNYETEYLRNKIRLKLVPFLDEEFPGWQRAVLSGAEKAQKDALFIQGFVEKFPVKVNKDGSVKLPLADYLKAPDVLKYRILLEACNKAGETSRIPHQFLKDVLHSLGPALENPATPDKLFKHFGSIDIFLEKKYLLIKKYKESNTDFIFSDIIEKTGTFEFPFGSLDVFNYREQDGKRFVSVCAGDVSVVEGVSLPFCVRNPQPGDTVLCASGSEKKVSDILSDWHVASSRRKLVPVIQLLDEKTQRIKAVLAGFLGYKDWIVKL